MNNRTLEEFWPWLVAPTVLSLVVFGVLFAYLAPGLRLEAGRASRFWMRIARTLGVRALPLVACGALVFAGPARAQGARDGARTVHAPANPVTIQLDLGSVTVKQGDTVDYRSILTNSTGVDSPPLCIAMNLVNLSEAGDVVDPEDWSPQRTQYLETLRAGTADTLSWRIHAILDGDYLVYMAVIPEPQDENSTSHVAASTGVHLVVTKFTKLDPQGILPYAIGGPLVLVLGIVWLARRRKKEVDEEAAP